MSTEECSAIPGEMQEEWRPVVGYEKYYSVSNLGRVRSTRGNKIKYLSLRNCEGYARVSLCNENGVKQILVHRLVALCFLLKCTGAQMQVNHKNGIRRDNRVENLEWCTPLQNSRHAIDILGRTKNYGKMPCGEQHPNAKLSAKDVQKIRELAFMGGGSSEIAKEFNLSCSHVYAIVTNRIWRSV